MKNSSSQILIEALIAITVVAFLTISISHLVVVSLISQEKSRKETIASFLTDEALEATRAVKAASWSNLTSGTYHPDKSGGVWALLPGDETINIQGIEFRRRIEIAEAQRDSTGKIVETGGTTDPSTFKITATINWESKVLTLISYLTRYINQIWQQTTTSDFNLGTKNSVEVTNVAGGEVQLIRGGISFVDFGNKFLVTSISTVGEMTSSAFKSSIRFTALNTKTVSSLNVYLDKANKKVTYRYGIQEDAGGIPSGSYLSYGDLTTGKTGWSSVNLNTPVNLTASSVYHLVIQYQSGNISTRNYIVIRNSQPKNGLVALDCSADLQADTLWYDGSSWTLQDKQPVYVLSFDDGSFEGNSYDIFTERAIYALDVFGENFLTKGEKVKEISFYLAKNRGQNPADSLYFSLIDQTTGETIIDKAVLATGPDLTTSYSWKTLTFSSSLVLIDGHQYLISLESPNSKRTRHYKIYSSSTTFASNSLTYQKEDAQEFISGSLNPSSDLAGFKFTQILEGEGYVTSGIFESSTFDAGNPAGFNRLSFMASVPLGTTLRFQTASNNDNAIWNFVGPDGTSSTFYDSSSALFFGLSNNQYFRYKAYLETTDQTQTPVLYEVNLNWSP